MWCVASPVSAGVPRILTLIFTQGLSHMFRSGASFFPPWRGRHSLLGGLELLCLWGCFSLFSRLWEALPLDSVPGKLIVLMAARSHSWFFRHLRPAWPSKGSKWWWTDEGKNRAKTAMAEALDAKLAHWKLKMDTPKLTGWYVVFSSVCSWWSLAIFFHSSDISLSVFPLHKFPGLGKVTVIPMCASALNVEASIHELIKRDQSSTNKQWV